MSVAAVYFGLFGPLAVCIGVALLVDFKGMGSRWENEVNRSSASVGRVFGWPPNRYVGRTYRPVVAVFFVLLGVAMLIGVLTGAIR